MHTLYINILIYNIYIFFIRTHWLFYWIVLTMVSEPSVIVFGIPNSIWGSFQAQLNSILFSGKQKTFSRRAFKFSAWTLVGISAKKNLLHWEKYQFVMTILDPTENYFHIDNKRILLITTKQVITSERSERISC